MVRSLGSTRLVTHGPVCFLEQAWTASPQHIANAVFMAGELALSNIPFVPYLMGFVGLYSGVFALWAWTYYVHTNRWLYPARSASFRVWISMGI